MFLYLEGRKIPCKQSSSAAPTQAAMTRASSSPSQKPLLSVLLDQNAEPKQLDSEKPTEGNKQDLSPSLENPATFDINSPQSKENVAINNSKEKQPLSDTMNLQGKNEKQKSENQHQKKAESPKLPENTVKAKKNTNEETTCAILDKDMTGPSVSHVEKIETVVETRREGFEVTTDPSGHGNTEKSVSTASSDKCGEEIQENHTELKSTTEPLGVTEGNIQSIVLVSLSEQQESEPAVTTSQIEFSEELKNLENRPTGKLTSSDAADQIDFETTGQADVSYKQLNENEEMMPDVEQTIAQEFEDSLVSAVDNNGGNSEKKDVGNEGKTHTVGKDNATGMSNRDLLTTTNVAKAENNTDETKPKEETSEPAQNNIDAVTPQIEAEYDLKEMEFKPRPTTEKQSYLKEMQGTDVEKDYNQQTAPDCKELIQNKLEATSTENHKQRVEAEADGELASHNVTAEENEEENVQTQTEFDDDSEHSLSTLSSEEDDTRSFEQIFQNVSSASSFEKIWVGDSEIELPVPNWLSDKHFHPKWAESNEAELSVEWV